MVSNAITASTGAVSKASGQFRTHYLVAIARKQVIIGRVGGRENVIGETIVDVGNAKSEQDARVKAVGRFCKAMSINPILAQVLNVRKVERMGAPDCRVWTEATPAAKSTVVLYDSAVAEKAESIAKSVAGKDARGKFEMHTIGSMTFKVRKED